ncbi:MAG: hypothetical protein PHS97_02010 [Oscillospiraceae bacterium]|nr:hypothetical protein [Oscillospiraceae bacterium]
MKLWKTAVLGYIGGTVYILLEILWRRWTHPSMFLVGGVCFILIGVMAERTRRIGMPLLLQAFAGAALVTAVELAAGLVLNRWAGLGVWDYSGLPANFLGQICLGYFLLWIPLSGAAILADDALRHLLFHEPMARARWI